MPRRNVLSGGHCPLDREGRAVYSLHHWSFATRNIVIRVHARYSRSGAGTRFFRERRLPLHSLGRYSGLRSCQIRRFRSEGRPIQRTPAKGAFDLSTTLRLIPGGPTSGAKGGATTDANGIPTRYVVESGDTLSGITYRFNRTKKQPAESNKVPFTYVKGRHLLHPSWTLNPAS